MLSFSLVSNVLIDGSHTLMSRVCVCTLVTSWCATATLWAIPFYGRMYPILMTPPNQLGNVYIVTLLGWYRLKTGCE